MSHEGSALNTLEPLKAKRGMDADSLKAGIRSHLEFTLGELPEHVDKMTLQETVKAIGRT